MHRRILENVDSIIDAMCRMNKMYHVAVRRSGLW
jgi:hypothetical protein